MRNTLVALLLLAFSFGMLHAAPDPSDFELTRRVKSALSARIGAPAREIEIIVTGGVVSLHGRVPSPALREAAESAAERAPGVRAVANNLSVGAGQ